MACGISIWITRLLARPSVAGPRAAVMALLAFMAAAGMTGVAAAAPSAVDPIAARLSVDTSGGYARLVFSAGEDIDATVRQSGTILIVSFANPVSVSVERLSDQASDYVAAARRDPDGRAVRLALKQKLTVNSMAVGDKFFVDLMPESWVGGPPGLPQEVVQELARRAREAERIERMERQGARKKKRAPIIVHVGTQPTFVRYTFDLPEQASATADRGKDRLTLTFDAPITFDLADALMTLPASVASIKTEVDQDQTFVRFGFLNKVDVRTFRDDKSYVVDVVGDNDKSESKAGRKSEAKTDAKTESKPEPKLESRSKSIPVGRTEGAADPAVSKSAANQSFETAAAKVVAEASAPPSNSTVPAASKTEPVAAMVEKPAAASKPDSDSKAETAPEANDPPSRPGIKSEAQADAKVEAKVESKPEAKPLAAAGAEGDAKSVAKAEPEAAANTKSQATPLSAPNTESKAVSTADKADAATTPSEVANAVGDPPAKDRLAGGVTTDLAAPAVQAPKSAAAEASKSGSKPTAAGEVLNSDPPRQDSTPVYAADPAPSQSASTPATTAPAATMPTATPPAAGDKSMRASAAEASSAPPGEAKAVKSVAAAKPANAAKSAEATKSGDSITVDLQRQGDALQLIFPFKGSTPAAVFARADTLWLVFDSKSAVDIAALARDPSRTVRDASFSRSDNAAIVRVRLDHPHLSSAALNGNVWTVTIGESIGNPIRPLDVNRNVIGPNRSSISILFDQPQHVHRLRDPDVGDDLFVVTGLQPSRGLLNTQDYVEFRALASTHGVAIQPLADDLSVDLAPDQVVVGRPNGLTLSSSLQHVLRGSSLRPALFDPQLWGTDREATYYERQSQLTAAAAAAPPAKRMMPRLDLARFYIARDLYPEAKGVLDAALSENHSVAEDTSAFVLRAVTEVMMNRSEDALKDLSNPAIGDQHEAPLWRALAYASQGKWAQARASFKRVEAAIGTLPVELQRVALRDEVRSAIEVGDYGAAAAEINDMETIGLPREMQPPMSVLIGRLAEGMGRNEDALAAYQTAADSWDRPSAAQGRLREVALHYKVGDIKREDVISDLETLTTIWRGDETEIEALAILAHLYTEDGRYRDSFYVMRSAMAAHPDSEMTCRIQDEAAKTFEALFLSGKGDSLPAIDALALFYDFRELTPIGRRGDEMIRRLADRLVSVDLLDQASDLLQYQVDHRLDGAARAQVATRLAVIYLVNRKPDRALAALRATRAAAVATELRTQRLLLEARALSDLGRHDLALEVIANIEGHEAIRLRSDILWAAHRWAKSAEEIELLYGDRWKEWQPLNDAERADILRAAVGYALGEDMIGLERFRERYAPKMAQTPDEHAFQVVSAPLGTTGAEFRDIAHAAASFDTLESFLREMQARFPDAAMMSPANSHTSAKPVPPAATSAPATKPAAVPRPSANSGRTAGAKHAVVASLSK